MRKRRWAVAGFLVLLVILLAGLESQHIVSGWFRGEAFYRGRPTSYWRAELERWVIYPGEGKWGRDRTFFDVIRERGRMAGPVFGSPPFCDGDPAATDVLQELAADPSTRVRELAAMGMGLIHPRERNP